MAPPTDPYSNWLMPQEYSKPNSLQIERQKYIPGQKPMPTSVPTSLPQQNSRLPSAPPHSYSSYKLPSETRLPQTSYSQASHTGASTHSSHFNPAQSAPAKAHQVYAQPPGGKTNQIPASQSGSTAQSHAAPGQANSAPQPHHYPYPYAHTVAAHYAQQQLRQQKSSAAYPPFSLPPTTKSSSSSSLPPPLLTPQQSAHQAYLYAQHRNEATLAMYQAKRSNQLSPHPSGSPHPSASPHPTASPNTAASPHPSASPHHKAASPHSTVSSHPGQQSRIPQYSPHAAQRPPSASTTQHPSQGYPGSLPPSPYSSHQSHTSHTTPPSSRPPSTASQHSHQSQPQHSPYSSQPSPSPVQPPPPHTSQSSQPYPVSSQTQSPHPPPSHPPPHSSQSRIGGPIPPQSSHPSQPRPHPSVSTTQPYHSHVTSPYSTYHTQANIYSQPHPTWTTQSYSSHSKATDSHHSQGHHPSQSHSYLPQGYPPHSQSMKPPNSQANLPLTHPPQAYQAQPHPSQGHPPHPHSSHSHPHPPTAHPAQSIPPPAHPTQSPLPMQHGLQPHAPPSHPPHSNAPPAHPSQSHVSSAYPPQSHPPSAHPSQPYPPPTAHPPQSSSSQSHLQQPHSSQVPPSHPYPSKPHPPHIQASAQHASQAHATQGHPRPPHPTQTFPPQPHQPPTHSSQPHPSQTHPQQPHTTHAPAQQPHHAHAHPQTHSLQGSPPQAHPSQTSSQAPPSHPHHTPPTHPHSQPQSQPPHAYPAQTHPPQTHPSQSHPPQSHASQPQPTQSQSSQLQPHSSQAPQEPVKASIPEAHSSQVYPPHSHHSQSHSADAHSKSAQSHAPQPPQTSVVQPPKSIPPQIHNTPAHSATHPPPSQGPQSQAPHVQPHPSQPSVAPHPPSSPQVGHTQGHASQPQSPRGHPLQGQTQSHSQSHSPRGYTAQPHSPRSHPGQPHPSQGQPHMYPPHEYPSQPHPSYDHHVQAYTPQGHNSRIHHAPSHPHHPQVRLPYPSIRHPYPPTTQSQPAHQKHPPYVSQPSVPPHSTSGHISEAHQHPGYPHHGQHPYYPPPQVKLEGTGGASHYPHYPYPHPPHAGSRTEMQMLGGAPQAPVQQQPVGVSSTSKQSQEYDPSRIRTKGEQKSFDPRNVDGAKSNGNAESQDGDPENDYTLTELKSVDMSESHKNSILTSDSLQASIHENFQKSATVCKEEEKENSDQLQSTGKSVEPGKAALAEKLHKKLQHAESIENLVAKRENVPECVMPKKEEPVEDEWDKGFDKLMEDLAANPEGVTSKKSRRLGRRYLQKVQIQDAIEHDLIAPPILIEEEEEESEPEPPVKFRGKFKSIKDKKVERLILTYASHSDESAVDMIPDEDASDFEEELKREIRLKSKKRGHSKRAAVAESSSGSDAEKNMKNKGSTRGRNKENKPNNKQDSDYSYSSSSSSDSVSSSSSDDSDSEDSDSESARPTRRGRKSDIEKMKKGKKWDSDSSDSEEEFVPKRRTRRGQKSSSDDESFRSKQKNKKRKKKQDSSDSEDIPVKVRRGKKSESDSEEEEEEKIKSGRGKRRLPLGKRFKKRRKDDSDEDSEKEAPRKTRGMKKKIQNSKERRRNQISASSSSESEKNTNKKVRKKADLRKKNDQKDRSEDDSSEDSDIPMKKKHISKSHVIVDSDDSEPDSSKDSPKEKNLKKDMPKEEESSLVNERESEKEALEEKDLQEEEEAVEEFNLEEELELQREPDSVIEKLNKIRDEELNREDVQEMKAWLGEVSRDIEKQLGNLQDVASRNYWRKPQFGAGEDFLQGWQNDVKKYKEISARFPKKLCLAAKHQVAASASKSSPRKGRDQEASKESPKRVLSSPAKNTRSKSGIIKTSMSVAEDERLKVAARPEISSVMQRFFEKVLADSNDSAKEESTRKFNLDPFSAFSTQRVPTGLTPTPSVAPSMLASDDSDLDSLASLRMDLPASDSVPVSRRSIASSLLKKIGRKYNDKKLNTMYLTKARAIMQVTNKPQLLPTPGMPTSEKDLEEMSPDQLKLKTFFRKETVNNYRGNFENIITKNGINEFTPVLYQSRTRNKNRQIQDAATIKSVFGFDIPPHVLKKKEAKQTKKVTKKLEKKEDVKKEESSAVPVSRASTPGGSMLAHGDDDDDSELRSERSESVLGESSMSHVPKRVKRKFRKFRSGFDYIRKKKKVKADDEATPSRKRLPVRKHVNWPEQSRDVASEVRTWVVNKGLGETVLHKAARLGYHDVVVYCAESPDFDINVRDNAGYTPLHEACNRGHLDIAQVLCVHGAHVNAPGYKGMRPLHEAVENGHGELARLLLAYGADPTLTTYAGQNCLALSADIQTTRLVEGFMADLKGQRISDMWYFAGPATVLDPDEQGCDIFGSVPGSNTLQSTDLKCLEESKKTEDVIKLESTSIDEIANDQTALGTPTNISLLKEVKVEGVVSEQKSSLTESHDPKVLKKTKATGESDVQDKIKSEMVKDSECKSDVSASETKETRADADSVIDENDNEWELKELIFEASELPMLDLFEVEGRPHKYHLLLELLAHLKMTYKEFIVSATSVETLELTIEEFESRAHSCIVGSCGRDVVDACSRVILVRVTPSIQKLLGIEAVRL